MALHDAGVLSALVCAIFGDDEPLVSIALPSGTNDVASGPIPG
jgi:hypothetical protein